MQLRRKRVVLLKRRNKLQEKEKKSEAKKIGNQPNQKGLNRKGKMVEPPSDSYPYFLLDFGAHLRRKCSGVWRLLLCLLRGAAVAESLAGAVAVAGCSCASRSCCLPRLAVVVEAAGASGGVVCCFWLLASSSSLLLVAHWSCCPAVSFA
ncbi:hypothetical protein H5410_052503 [Solanum commersonii]|uniref:Uncharacterized protein n=1 Tax=Solanum commersonii TaxID=4109 RepID=A0A9J5X3K3_SOLCO|nr:hypothetical protein H5410_052503 [Solanum commersonii]